MNQQIKQAWITALRSGAYQQGRHKLRRGEEYCCLGVLCDLYQEGSWELFDKEDEEDAGVYTYVIDKDNRYDAETDVLPAVIQEWADIHVVGELSDYVEINHYDRYKTLTDINDSGIVDFNGMADIIEKYL